MIDHANFTICKSAKPPTVTFTMKHDLDGEEDMMFAAEALKTYLRKVHRKAGGAEIPLLIDLRRCSNFTPRHVLTTVRVLIGEQEALMSMVSRSAVVLRLDDAVAVLSQAFQRLYTPVKPFRILCDESEARGFLAEGWRGGGEGRGGEGRGGEGRAG